MGFLPSLGEAPHLYDVMSQSPRMAIYLFKMTDEIMLAEGPLTPAEREIVAAYVSGLNACSFCYRGHKAIAEIFGVKEGLIDALVEDFDNAEVDEKLRAILAYSRKLTETPSRMVSADAQAVFDAGWGEDALMNVVEIVALFAMYNRIADGAGVIAENTKTTLTKKKLGSYIDNLVNFGVSVPDEMTPAVDVPFTPYEEGEK